MNNKKQRIFSRGQFVSISAVVLSLLIITGVSVAYVGISSQQEKDNQISPRQDIEESALTISRASYDVFSAVNQDPAIANYPDRKDAVNNTVREYIKSYNSPNSVVYGTVDYKIQKIYPGYMVSQTNPNADLTAKGDRVWKAFSGAKDARQAVMILNLSSMPEFGNSTQPGVEINRNGNKFEVSYQESTSSVQLDYDGDSCTVADIEGDRAKVDFLRGEINGIKCGDIRVDSAVESLTVYSGKTGNQTPKGTFSTIYHEGSSSSPVDTTDPDKRPVPGYGEADTPEQTKVVYAAVVDIRVVNLDSSITTPVIISPGKHQTQLD